MLAPRRARARISRSLPVLVWAPCRVLGIIAGSARHLGSLLTRRGEHQWQIFAVRLAREVGRSRVTLARR
jgi:hypothetical protein